MWKITNAVARAFGVRDGDRIETVKTMLESGVRGRGGYWLQLFTAMVIATLGLALNSTAVVIGGMLVSPLMGPILHLGMGLAIGSPLLTVRSALRVVSSAAFVVGGATLVTLALPTNDITSEISARTSPTLLDLAIASACAIAGVYAAIRSGSDTATTAAGTAIGIALVPPLCVVGFGIGTASAEIAGGAALLFTANFCAIVFFGVIGFLLCGYATVPVGDIERAHTEEFPSRSVAARAARRVSAFFSTRTAILVRILMPLSLVFAVLVPLRSALAKVTWEVRVRNAIASVLRTMPAETVASTVHIERHTVAIRLVTIGGEDSAARIRDALRERLAEAAPDTQPTIEISTVADASALARAEAALRDRESAAAVVPLPPPPRDLAAVRRDVDVSLEAWPTDASGALLARSFAFGRSDGDLVVTVVHVGAPLGPAAEDVLARSIGRTAGATAHVRDVALAPAGIDADPEDGTKWLVAATSALAEARALVPDDAHLVACIETPSGDRAGEVLTAMASSPLYAPPGVVHSDGARWSLHWAVGSCAAPSTAPDAAASDAPATAADAAP